MSTYNKSWHAVLDTPEQIQMCFECKRSECVDCIGRRIDCSADSGKSKKKAKKKED